VEASFFLDFLDTFSSRKKFQYLIAKGKKSNFPVVGVTTNHLSISLWLVLPTNHLRYFSRS
jgi:hypothetical protein